MKHNKIKTLLIAVASLMVAGVANAQTGADNLPKTNSILVSASVAYNSFNGAAAPATGSSLYENAALANQWTKNPLMIGVEASWFVNPNWELQLGGGFAYTYKPGYAEHTGVAIGGEEEEGSIGNVDVPTYRAVANATDMSYTLFVGAAHNWALKSVPNMMLYAGARVGFSYGLAQAKYDEASSMGISVSECTTFRVQTPVGVKYFVARGLFLGLEVSPIAYGYNVNTLRPQEGLASFGADSHEFSFLAAPTLKIGFRF